MAHLFQHLKEKMLSRRVHQQDILNVTRIRIRVNYFENIEDIKLQAKEFLVAAMEEGVMTLVAGASIVRFAPSLIIPDADIAEGFESIVNLLRGRKNIVVLTGAGISVSCGIPDFRSKGSGLYSTLNHEVSLSKSMVRDS